jgi:NADPH:quinone reductase-like Zn-dependent oxidoreductase
MKPGDRMFLSWKAVPFPKRDVQVLIRVRAFELNRSELFIRQGHSPKSAVQFPQVLSIEAVGTVEVAPGGEFETGDIVATAMGGRTAVPCWQRTGLPHSCARLFQAYVSRLKLQ